MEIIITESFKRWLSRLKDRAAIQRVQARIRRASEGNLGDSKFLRDGIGDIAREKGMSKVASDTGLARESLYRALSADGNPEFSTIMKVMNSLGLRFHKNVA